MGTIKQGILGGFSGKVGNVVGGSWKGIDYMRVLPQTVSNPQTPGQLAQRLRFSLTMGFLQPLAEFVKTGFKNYAVKKTGINAAMGYNIKNALTGVYPNITVSYADALVTRGSLPAPLNPAVASTVPSTVAFTWDDNSDETGADASDKSLVVVYTPTLHQAVTVNGGATRGDGTQSVTVPAAFTGAVVQCYIGYIDAKNEDLSSSRYAGNVTVA